MTWWMTWIKSTPPKSLTWQQPMENMNESMCLLWNTVMCRCHVSFLEVIQYILENEMFDSWQMFEGSRFGDSQWLVTNYGLRKTVVKMWIYVLNKTYTYKYIQIYISSSLGLTSHVLIYWWFYEPCKDFSMKGSNLRMTLKRLKNQSIEDILGFSNFERQPKQKQNEVMTPLHKKNMWW